MRAANSVLPGKVGDVLEAEPRPTALGICADRRIERMERFILQHYIEPLEVPAIARAAGLHPNYASALFRQGRGMPLVEALARRRVNHAQALLAATDATVLDVALSSGFQSLSRFYAAFKRFCGRSPAQFRADQTRRVAPGNILATGPRAPLAHVLWIDDQPLNNTRERRLLAQHGIFTEAYSDNRTGLRAFENERFDAVISDIHRGGAAESGWDLLRTVRGCNQGLPFFFYTGRSDARLRSRAERAAAFGTYDRARDLVDALLRTLPEESAQT